MADPLHVEVVSADRLIWSGEATTVLARTMEGDLGIMPNHALLLGVLDDGVVEVRTPDDGSRIVATHGGFLSVAGGRVSILAEFAELASEIDVEQARRELDRARETGAGDEAAHEEVRRAETQIRAVEKAR